jgi:glutamine---fructose-6-phosphate transaminase (isomerizing)
MCGIIGCVCGEPVAPALMQGLRRVEYRGYDSAGMATIHGGRMQLKKGVGRVAEIEARLGLSKMEGSTGMAHTRWATHGGVTAANAHPQTACRDVVAVVHNGIIENCQPLRRQLKSRGHAFKSETDTEVIAHLIEEAYSKRRDPVKATTAAVSKLKGQYAICVMFQDRPEVMVGARKDAPLIIGVGDGKMFISSDVLAFIEHTDRTIFLDNMEVAEVSKTGVKLFDHAGRRVRRKATQVAWELSDLSKSEYAHYTLKEINEQPKSVLAAAVQDAGRLEEFAAAMREADSLFITAAGTSFHAALLLKYRLEREARIRCETILAGELPDRAEILGRKSVLVAISQSGETADVLEAVKAGKRRGAKVLSMINAAGSSLARESAGSLLLNCGPEVGVAATKSFTAQVTLANLVVDALIGSRANGVRGVSRAVSEALKCEPEIKRIVKEYGGRSDFYFIARGYNYPMALEGALKLKELSYIHAEGMAASELKHGTLALIERGTPVVVINPSGAGHEDALASAEELRARGADVIGISDVEDEVYTHCVQVPKVPAWYAPVVEAVPLQLLAYHMSLVRRNDPDYPRNLAKSVTVK